MSFMEQTTVRDGLHREYIESTGAIIAGRDVEVFSPAICARLLRRGLIDEIDIHHVPVLLGDGIRL
jgi:dihydrofolate reductase